MDWEGRKVQMERIFPLGGFNHRPQFFTPSGIHILVLCSYEQSECFQPLTLGLTMKLA
jgi:hypothetical protein